MLDAYAAVLSARGYSVDAAQRDAALRLQQLYYQLLSFKVGLRSALSRVFSLPELPRGVCLGGAVATRAF